MSVQLRILYDAEKMEVIVEIIDKKTGYKLNACLPEATFWRMIQTIIPDSKPAGVLLH